MPQRLSKLAVTVVTLTALLAPTPLLAQTEIEVIEGRRVGYQRETSLTGEGNKLVGDNMPLNYFILLFVGSIALGVLFKNAKRTHLD